MAIGFIRSDVGASTLFFMTDNDTSSQTNYALDALTKFVQSFIPATETDFTDCFTTQEIVYSINELTGHNITHSDVYRLLTDMHFTYKAFIGLDFKWLLKKA